MADTNTIYPPDHAYKQATEELKSPVKKRPLSGGPSLSPDKNPIEKVLQPQKLEVKILSPAEPTHHKKDQENENLKNKVFKDCDETSKRIRQTQIKIARTRADLQETIETSKKQIHDYKQTLHEQKEKME